MTDLLIVESPAKAKTISKYLGPGYEVIASLGHVRDLPQSSLGVSIEDGFTPTYVDVPGKEKTLKELKRAAKGKGTVFLGPDPDREGEAIAWHIAEYLGRDSHNFKRVLLHELTPGAIKAALADPTDISLNRFESQQTRRILDRLMGYLISPVLWSKLKRGLSAGRVQSAALRLVVERERKIYAFVPDEYWSLDAFLTKDGQGFKAALARRDGKKLELKTGDETRACLAAVEGKAFRVASVVSKERRRNAPPPFTTSTLQQAAYSRLGLAPARTMRLAQQLYEGVELPEGNTGLITYMRTDSVRVNDQAAAEALELAGSLFGPDHVPSTPNRYKNRKGAQDAHEAIRPSSAARTPASLEGKLPQELLRLYSLVWSRFLGSQMAPAVFQQTAADLECEGYGFRATGQVMRFDGFLAAWGPGPGRAVKADDAPESADAESSGADTGSAEAPEGQGQPDTAPAGDREEYGDMLPPLAEGESLVPDRLVPAQHFTQPPPRFNDATLVKELESRGIGRPSTYAATISVLRAKAYCEGPKGQLRPTEMGLMVNDLLVGSFPRLLDYAFTADMEEDLDQIEEGHAERLAVLEKLYSPLAESLDAAKISMLNVKTDGLPIATACPKCGVTGEMRIRYGKSGFYLSCGACGATCDFTRDERGEPVPVPDPELAEEVNCPKCGRPMLVKKGRFGPFLACSGYPECRSTQRITVEDGMAVPQPDEEPPDFPEGSPRECPKCGSPMVVKRARAGSWFLGCSKYPKCKETMPFPSGFACPVPGCGGQIVERSSKRGAFMGCSNFPRCRFLTRGELVKDPCPECGFPYRVRPQNAAAGPDALKCPNSECPTFEKRKPSPRAEAAAKAREARELAAAEAKAAKERAAAELKAEKAKKAALAKAGKAEKPALAKAGKAEKAAGANAEQAEKAAEANAEKAEKAAGANAEKAEKAAEANAEKAEKAALPKAEKAAKAKAEKAEKASPEKAGDAETGKSARPVGARGAKAKEAESPEATSPETSAPAKTAKVRSAEALESAKENADHDGSEGHKPVSVRRRPTATSPKGQT
ncbi:MAG: type I DNA topoisomerase [Deltaproteobacteria bacterium]|jgi:DNA topoisomerase-1|nr:type I DNA topoisomerase [Deltaproteobacteria bacterium]